MTDFLKVKTSDGDDISVKYLTLQEILNNKSTFTGNKLHHPFEQIKGKNGTHYTKEFTSNDVDDDISNAVRFEIKHNGCCGYIKYDKDTQSFIPMTRYDIKENKSTGDFSSPNSDWIPCEEKPSKSEFVKGVSRHWPHFRSCLEKGKEKDYGYQLEAFNMAIKSGKLDNIKESFTCEYMGKKINYDNMDPIEQNALIVPHGSYTIDIPNHLRNYEGFKKVLIAIPDIEGIIVHGKSGTLYKIRRNMYDDIEMINSNQTCFSKYASLYASLHA